MSLLGDTKQLLSETGIITLKNQIGNYQCGFQMGTDQIFLGAYDFVVRRNLLKALKDLQVFDKLISLTKAIVQRPENNYKTFKDKIMENHFKTNDNLWTWAMNKKPER